MSQIIVQLEAQNIWGYCGMLLATYKDLTPDRLDLITQAKGTGSHNVCNAGLKFSPSSSFEYIQYNTTLL